ncbi:MAG: glucose-1-phosphate adenylyltransferase [Planctomycetota bacterium]|jgi:glucose-1-phosphate adenylyltransferase|nr:glucose-1-phosphate adenylyltransferase [Planctomycetota bacterium]MDA1200693.1 glucose-1-phosphate adenylyltransferase [Planctomycetota bacterium]
MNVGRVLALVLGGGRGTRLYPLTRDRSKPAVPLAGKYRIIDVPLSNCINSGVQRIYVVTQFNSVSLHRHIRRTYTFDAFSGGFVEILAAQQTLDSGAGWYQGTADAVRQNLRYLQQPDIKHVLILSGDQLYRMNYADMLATHIETGANVTIAGIPVHEDAASALGIMRMDAAGKVLGFLEKPQTTAELEGFRTDPAWIDSRGVPANGRNLMASMGIYLFDRDCLLELLTKTDYQDFGREVFPAAIRAKNVQLHVFDGYWEDIGTIRSYYQCNLDLARAAVPFEFVEAGAPVYSRARFLPPSRIAGASIRESLISDGCTIGEGAVIENSVIGLRCRIGKNVVIRNSVVLGNDYYETPDELAGDVARGEPPLGIGDGSIIEGAIIDKNVHLGAGTRIVNDHDWVDTADCPRFLVRDGVAVVPRGAVVPDGWIPEPGLIKPA